MTTIDVGDDYIHVSGHSGYAEEGHDIVCAGISVLTESLDRYLRRTENQVESTKDDGEYKIYLKHINDNGGAIINEYVRMIDEIIEEYPDNVRRINNGKA